MSLTTNLVSYWKLDEASGNAADSVGSNTLTNIGTATYAAGKINNGLVASPTGPKLLSITTGTGLNITGDLSISCWVKFTSLPTDGNYMGLVSRWNATTGNRCYTLIVFNVSGTYYVDFVTRDAAGNQYSFSSNNHAFSTGTWYHIVATYKASTTTKVVYINDSAVVTDASQGADIANGTASFNLGCYYTVSGTYDGVLDGVLDEAGIWSRALASTEVTTLYNSGNGLQYPFVETLTNSNFFLVL